MPGASSPSPALEPSISPALFLAGPTASGKSSTALLLASALNAEIVSVDSMQVYRDMNIGTAKPSATDRRTVPHHLLDLIDLHEPFDAARFIRHATEAVNAIHARGKRALFCGGTGLYFKAWMEGIGEAPPSDETLRRELENTPLPELLDELQKRDPNCFQQIDRQNPRRVIRAIEVIRLTGIPYSEQRSPWSQKNPAQPMGTFVYLCRKPEDLRARIEARVDSMFREGWVEETAMLRDKGLEQSPGAMQALGYRWILEHLRGERSLKETVEWIKIRTWQYARRQATWFKRQTRATWLELEPGATPEQVATALRARWEQGERSVGEATRS